MLSSRSASRGLIASDARFAVELYPSQAAAEAALHEVLSDEPGYADILAVVALDFDPPDTAPDPN